MDMKKVSMQDLNGLKKSLDSSGYGVVRGIIDKQSILDAIRRINLQVETVAAAYGATKDPDTCSVLLSLTKQLKNTPSNWTDPQNPLWRLRFGNYGRRGWMRGIGSGKMFDGEDFTEDANIIRIQESRRHVFAFLHSVDEEYLERYHERVSVKCPGCPKFKAHIDGNRLGSYQAVIALSHTNFLVYPRSHLATFLPSRGKYYSLTTGEVRRLGYECDSFETRVQAKPGDVLFFVGGTFVHGSVGVRRDEPDRYVTFAQFWPRAQPVYVPVPEVPVNPHISVRQQLPDVLEWMSSSDVASDDRSSVNLGRQRKKLRLR